MIRDVRENMIEDVVCWRDSPLWCSRGYKMKNYFFIGISRFFGRKLLKYVDDRRF